MSRQREVAIEKEEKRDWAPLTSPEETHFVIECEEVIIIEDDYRGDRVNFVKCVSKGETNRRMRVWRSSKYSFCSHGIRDILNIMAENYIHLWDYLILGLHRVGQQGAETAGGWQDDQGRVRGDIRDYKLTFNRQRCQAWCFQSWQGALAVTWKLFCSNLYPM